MEVVTPTIDISSLIHVKSSYLMIPKAQPIMGVVMKPNQDKLDNGGRELA